MSGNNEVQRPDRVRRLKKMIIALIFVLLIVPLGCSITMLFRIRAMDRQIAGMTEEVQQLKSRLEQANRETAEKAVEPAPASEKEPDSAAGSASRGQSTQQEKDAGASEEEKKETCKVYLTFDDGPSSNTAAILDLLKKYNVKATFFVTGKEGENYEALYKRIVEEGHTLGMHSYSHRYRDIYASREAFATDLEKLQDYLYVTTGVWSRFYRFPGGSSNQVSKVPMQELADYLSEQDIYYMDWNIVSGDAAGGTHSAKALSDRVLRYIGAEETEVVLMHDAAEKSTTVDALAIILENITKRDDVEILPVSEEMDFETVQHLKN